MSVSSRLALATAVACIAVPIAGNAGTFSTLYTFTGKSDGGNPRGPLLYHRGALFGTTPFGGSGDGNVFKLNASSGAFKNVYVFSGGNDGAYPYFGVIYNNSKLYGTTEAGGSPIGTCTIDKPNGCGTIFSIDLKSGSEHVMYSFGGVANPTQALPGELAYLAGNFYGTTAAGGTNGAGSFFSIDPATGAYSTLYSFTGGTDGASPNSPLLYKNGVFYGAAAGGGKNCAGLHGCGLIFSIDPTTGTESVLHAFGPDKGGRIPFSNLIYHAHSLMGDTEIGGDRENYKRGEGVSFSINTNTGHEKVVDTFVTRGQSYFGLTLVGDKVYETLPTGGSGNGELDQVDLTTGQRSVLYQFAGGADGSDPLGSLTYSDGVFYGTTYSGGNHGCLANQGCGTIFKYVP